MTGKHTRSDDEQARGIPSGDGANREDIREGDDVVIVGQRRRVHCVRGIGCYAVVHFAQVVKE